MIVFDTDENGQPLGRLVFKVSSRRGLPPYTVDLGSYRKAGVGCNGKCDCQDFLANKWPIIRDNYRLGKFSPSDETRCAHILFLRREKASLLFDRWLEVTVKESNDYDGEWD